MEDGQTNSPNARARLSEHFHKVRLTSLFLSTALLLASLDIPLTFIGISWTSDRAHEQFIIASLLIAALTSFLHVWTLWYGEAVDADARLARTHDLIEEISELTNRFSTLGKSMAETSGLLSSRVVDLERISPSIADVSLAREQLHDLLSPQDIKKLQVELATHAKSWTSGTAAIYQELPSRLYASVHSTLQNLNVNMNTEQSVKFTSSLTSTVEEAIKERSQQTQEFMNAHRHSFEHNVQKSIDSMMVNLKNRLDGWINIKSLEREQTELAIHSTRQLALDAHYKLIIPVESLDKSLRIALSPLRRSA